jgi:branched-chain amino acid transport system ATP-binding protein
VLEVANVSSGYGSLVALHGISLSVPQAALVAVLGANGAGKTTLLRTISGLLPCRQGAIRLQGLEIHAKPSHEITRLGVSHVPEGRRIFPECTVRENLRLGAYTVRDRAVYEERLNTVCTLFPRLRERLRQPAGTLSGGEQQMLALGRALMLKPRLLLLDEPSLGLAPLVVEMLFECIVEINGDGTTILLVEQNVYLALEIARYAYVLRSGRVVAEGTPPQLAEAGSLEDLYLSGTPLRPA